MQVIRDCRPSGSVRQVESQARPSLLQCTRRGPCAARQNLGCPAHEPFGGLDDGSGPGFGEVCLVVGSLAQVHGVREVARRPRLEALLLHYVREAEESKKLNGVKGPVIIIAASGMAEHGRILHHLKHSIGDPTATVMLVSWQAENTLGRRLFNGDEVVRIFGEEYKRRCRVEVVDEFSAHADHDGLVEWVKAGKDRWQRVFVVHGEEEASFALARALQESGIPEVVVPEVGQTVAL